MTRPDPTTYALSAAYELTLERLKTRARCKTCRKRLGEVYATEHGPLWVGELGGNRRGRSSRRMVFLRAGHETDGRNMVAQWVEQWRQNYICDCECTRNSADGRVIYRAVMAGVPDVEIPPQRDSG